jgi:hypothetical protein
VVEILGLIYTIIVSVGAFFHSILDNIENEKCKSKYEHPNGITYVDVKGRTRLLSNDELVYYVNNSNGDYVLEDESGNIYKNFSEEQRKQKNNERKNEAINKKETTFCIDDNNYCKDWICKGKRFKDLNTGDIYVIRYINYKYYYMNISNGMIIRKTDWQIKKDMSKSDYEKRWDVDINIEEFNEKQKTIQKKVLLYRDFNINTLDEYYK